jgi:hypothetical protein
MEIGEAVPEARPEVEQRCGRSTRHAGVPVGCAGDDTLK